MSRTLVTEEDIQKHLQNFDWKKFNQHLDWRLQMPRCNFYDGEYSRKHKAICPVWQNWLAWGKELYEGQRKTLRGYIQNLREIVPEGHLGVEHSRIEQFLASAA